MVYCSKTCQQLDWDARHRSECDSLRRLRDAEPTLESELPLRRRVNLAAFVERMCNQHLKAFQKFAQRAFAAPFHSLVLRINGLAVPCLGSLSTTVQFFESVKGWFGDGVPQRERINGYLMQMLAIPQVHIAYAVFPLGLSTVHILARMWMDEGNEAHDNKFRVVSFMTIGVRWVDMRLLFTGAYLFLANARLIRRKVRFLVGYISVISWLNDILAG
jgi:hypothetical protein